MVEEDIKLGIIETRASEMVMAGVSKVDGDKLVLGAEMFEES